MEENLLQSPHNNAALARAAEECNEISARYGLRLSQAQLMRFMQRREQALGDAGRVEFGQGILKPLVLEFCDSPYIEQEDWEETLLALQDCFYYFKNETRDALPDDELLAAMRRGFDESGGSLEYLFGMQAADLGGERGLADELDGDEEAEEE